jgi:chitinase
VYITVHYADPAQVWQYPNAKGDWAQTVRGSAFPGGSAPSKPSGGSTPKPAGGCTAWSAGMVYTQGKTASYNGKTYTAQWWTQGEKPGSSAAWKEGGSC